MPEEARREKAEKEEYEALRKRKQEARERRRKEGRRRIGLDYLSLLKTLDAAERKGGRKRTSSVEESEQLFASALAYHTPRESVIAQRRDEPAMTMRDEAANSHLVVRMPSVAEERAEEARRSSGGAG